MRARGVGRGVSGLGNNHAVCRSPVLRRICCLRLVFAGLHKFLQVVVWCSVILRDITYAWSAIGLKVEIVVG